MYNRDMAFTVSDYADLIKLLREHPEWRAELRREILDDEFLRLPDYVKQTSSDIRALQAVVAQNSVDIRALQSVVAQNSVDIQQLVGETHEFRVGVEARLRQIDGELSQLRGSDSERKWHEHAAGRFRHRLRRSRIVQARDLTLFEDADEAETITPHEALAVRRVDLFIEGVEGRGPEQRPALLVVEVSVGIEGGDIDRAAQRAKLLRGLGYNAYGVVAGNRITEATKEYADEQGVEIVVEAPKAYKQLSA